MNRGAWPLTSWPNQTNRVPSTRCWAMKFRGRPVTRSSPSAVGHNSRHRQRAAGRLFDAAAAIVLGIRHSQFDGQPAMWLEAAANRAADGAYELPVRKGRLWTLDWRPLITAILADRLAGEDRGTMAMRFHRAVAAGIVSICRHWSSLPVVLTGGVFQNRLLSELVLEESAGDTRPWGLPGVIPPGDGGLAAGQLAVAAMTGH